MFILLFIMLTSSEC